GNVHRVAPGRRGLAPGRQVGRARLHGRGLRLRLAAQLRGRGRVHRARTGGQAPARAPDATARLGPGGLGRQGAALPAGCRV
ncbi:MAG: hypothetical protein AVDCRST_MAG64-3503, partial [uncultured Phycisphaerae bacterium]